MMRSPTKLAPIFKPGAQTPKRKIKDDSTDNNEDVDSIQIDPKRMCSTPPVDAGYVSNGMILQAITSLTNRLDGMEAKIVTTVDARLLDFENGITAKVAQAENRIDEKLLQLEDDFHKNLQKRDEYLEDRIGNLEYTHAETVMEARIDYLERLALANELVIRGIPRKENENVNKICDMICESIGFNGKNTIQECFRVTSKWNNINDSSTKAFSPSIIIKFWSSSAKMGFFKLYIDKKSLCTTNIGFESPARIYVNENYTKKNFEIYRLACQLKAEGRIFQFHSFKGRISVKLNQEARPIGVDSREQLHDLIEDHAAQNQRKQQEPHQKPNQSKIQKAQGNRPLPQQPFKKANRKQATNRTRN